MTAPSPIKAMALLARARYAHHHREPVYLTPDEMAAFNSADALLPCTLFGVQAYVDPRRAAAQIADATENPAPPMDWEVS